MEHIIEEIYKHTVVKSIFTTRFDISSVFNKDKFDLRVVEELFESKVKEIKEYALSRTFHVNTDKIIFGVSKQDFTRISLLLYGLACIELNRDIDLDNRPVFKKWNFRTGIATFVIDKTCSFNECILIAPSIAKHSNRQKIC